MDAFRSTLLNNFNAGKKWCLYYEDKNNDNKCVVLFAKTPEEVLIGAVYAHSRFEIDPKKITYAQIFYVKGKSFLNTIPYEQFAEMADYDRARVLAPWLPPVAAEDMD